MSTEYAYKKMFYAGFKAGMQALADGITEMPIDYFYECFVEQFGLPHEVSSDWDEKRIDVIGSNGNDGLHYRNGWFKHDGSATCPVPVDTMVTIETWTPNNPMKKADEVDWSCVKFYRVEV